MRRIDVNGSRQVGREPSRYLCCPPLLTIPSHVILVEVDGQETEDWKLAESVCQHSATKHIIQEVVPADSVSPTSVRMESKGELCEPRSDPFLERPEGGEKVSDAPGIGLCPQ